MSEAQTAVAAAETAEVQVVKRAPGRPITAKGLAKRAANARRVIKRQTSDDLVHELVLNNEVIGVARAVYTSPSQRSWTLTLNDGRELVGQKSIKSALDALGYETAKG